MGLIVWATSRLDDTNYFVMILLSMVVISVSSQHSIQDITTPHVPVKHFETLTFLKVSYNVFTGQDLIQFIRGQIVKVGLRVSRECVVETKMRVICLLIIQMLEVQKFFQV